MGVIYNYSYSSTFTYIYVTNLSNQNTQFSYATKAGARLCSVLMLYLYSQVNNSIVSFS